MTRRRRFTTVGPTIHTIRERLGLTRAELADAAGLHETTIWRIEMRGVTPSLDTLADIARVLEVDVARLFKAP